MLLQDILALLIELFFSIIFFVLVGVLGRDFLLFLNWWERGVAPTIILPAQMTVGLGLLQLFNFEFGEEGVDWVG